MVLAVLAGLLTAGCLGGGEPEPKAVVVTVTQEPHASVAGPTPTWQQWLGEQVAKGECGDPSNILMYQNVSREPPYSADFFCWTTGSTPNAVARQVAATVAAIPTPTRQPTVTPHPTRQPQATLRPTLAPVSTPTPTWQQTATPFPTPKFHEWLSEEMSVLQCDDPRDQLKWGNGRRTWPYNADFWCVSPTPQPRATARPTAAPRPTVARYPTATPAPDGLPVLHAYNHDGELLVAAYVTWNDNSYIGAGVQLFQMVPGSGSTCVSTYHTESRSFGSWPPECHFEGQQKPYTVEVDFQGTTYLAVPVHYEENPFSRSSGKASEEPPWGEILGCSLAAGAAVYTGDVTLLASCIEFMEELLHP